MVTIERDPFARGDLVREMVEHDGDKDCDWCGQKGFTRSGRRLVHLFRLFRYGWQPDSISGRVNWDEKLFCSRGCRDSYFDLAS